MAEKHEFDVRILTRGSLSPEPARPCQPKDLDKSRLSSPPPPPYPEQDEYSPIASDINSSYPLFNLARNYGDLLHPGQPFKNVSSNSTSPTGSTTFTCHSNLSSRFLGRREDRNDANRSLTLRMPPTNGRISSQRNSGHFKSEVWETSEKTTMLVAPPSSKMRRYHSRTFPADSSTQPHLEECYSQPYSSISAPPSPLPEWHKHLKLTEDFNLKSECFEIRLHDLHYEIEEVTSQFNLLYSLLPKADDGLHLNIEASIWGLKEQTTYHSMQFLENQRLNMLKEMEMIERELMSNYKEWGRHREAKERFQQPLRIIAREMKERDVGRKWLRGEIPWADAVDMGRG